MKKVTGILGCLSCSFVASMLVILLLLITCWSDRTLDFWCTYFAHHAVNVPMWLSFLITIIGNGAMLTLNIISELARLIMGI